MTDLVFANICEWYALQIQNLANVKVSSTSEFSVNTACILVLAKINLKLWIRKNKGTENNKWLTAEKTAICSVVWDIVYCLQIKAAEIIDSDRFRCGFTLRFPRVEKFRDDKAWYDCMTLPEVTELKNVRTIVS